MKKLFLLIVSLSYAINSFSCWSVAYTCEEHKHFLIPNLFTESDSRQSLIATTNNLYNEINYNIYDYEREQLSEYLIKLGISKETIELMNTKIVASVGVEGNDMLNVVFESSYKHTKIKIYDITLDNFYPNNIIKEFEQKNQLELLTYLMYRHLVFFDSKYYVFDNYPTNFWDAQYLSKQVKSILREMILTEISRCSNHLEDDYAMLLIDMSLFNFDSRQVVVDYMNFLVNSKELNVVAYSHFAGSVIRMYAVSPNFDYLDYRNNNELSVYLFSHLLRYPKLFRQALSEISFVIDDRKNFDWDKCFSYCKTQEEKDRINLVKITIFSGVNISLFDYFKEQTTNDSKLFELALIQYIQRIEYNLFSPIYLSDDFKENYRKTSISVNKYVLADAIDLEKYIYKVDIENKVLLHMLRGYLSFMLGDFSKARKEYSSSISSIKLANYLSTSEKVGYKSQLDGLLVLERYNRDYSNNIYLSLNKRLTSFLKENYRKEELESYFELGMSKAVEKIDFATAFCYASKKGFHMENLMDIYMDNNDLHELLKIIDQNKLPFGDRHPTDLRYAVLEQIATNSFRANDLVNAKKYFDMLPDHIFKNGNGGRAYYQKRNPYWHEHYYDFPVDYSKDNIKIIKKFNKKTALFKIIELKVSIDKSEKQLNKLTNDSLKINLLRRKLSNLYFELSCIYSSPFWGYSRFWTSGLHYGISYANSAPFHLLDLKYKRRKLDSFLEKYGNQFKSIEYIKKSIFYTDRSEELAQLNFKLYGKLKQPFLTSFHKSRYYDTYWEGSIWGLNYVQKLEIKNLQKQKLIIGLLIDSLYNKTEYYKDVIAECSDFDRNDKIYIVKEKEYVAPKKNDKKGVNYKFVALFFLISTLVLFIFITIKNWNNTL